MQAPRGDLSSGMLAVTRVLVLKRTCLTGCLQQRHGTPFMKIHVRSVSPSRWLRGVPRGTSPVVHLPQLRSHPQLPHAHQPLTPTAHDLPVVHLYRRDAQMVGVERGHRGGSPQVEDPDPESQQRETPSLFKKHQIYQTCESITMINQQGWGSFLLHKHSKNILAVTPIKDD